MDEQEVFSLLEGAGDAAFAVDPQGLIRFWSRKAEDLLGYHKEQVLYKNCAQVLEGRNEAGSMVCCDDCQVLEIARKTGTVANYDFRARTASGQDKWLNVSILVFRLGRRRPPLHRLPAGLRPDAAGPRASRGGRGRPPTGRPRQHVHAPQCGVWTAAGRRALRPPLRSSNGGIRRGRSGQGQHEDHGPDRGEGRRGEQEVPA